MGSDSQFCVANARSSEPQVPTCVSSETCSDPSATAGCPSRGAAALSEGCNDAAGVVCNADTCAPGRRINSIRTPPRSIRSCSHRKSPSNRRGGGTTIRPPPITVHLAGSSELGSTEFDDDARVISPCTSPSTNPQQSATTKPNLDTADMAATAIDGLLQTTLDVVMPNSNRSAVQIQTGMLQSNSCCVQTNPSVQGTAMGGLEQDGQSDWNLSRPSFRRPVMPEWLHLDAAFQAPNNSCGQMLEQGCAPVGAKTYTYFYPAGSTPDRTDGSGPLGMPVLEGIRRQACTEPEMTLISNIRLRV